jgi:two-component system sensor histidine kinase RegB
VIAPFGLAAAICRTLAIAFPQRGGSLQPLLRGLSLCADVALLTALLDITGGPFNPFVVLFASYIWLAAVTLSLPWIVVVTVVSIGGCGWLLLDHVQADIGEHHRLNDLPAHLFTMWVAGAAVAELVAHYVTRARRALAEQQQQLDAAHERAMRSEHLAALTTLAAGAAHELSTPLATIAIAARELERAADRLSSELPSVEPLRDDARLIRREVDRCQVVLDNMSGRASAGTAAAGEPLAPTAIVDLVRARLSDEQRSRLRVAIAPRVAAPAAAGAAVVQAVASLINNAFEASEPGSAVWLRCDERDMMIRISVHDSGPGMSADVLRRAGEPFFTTKPTGRGMGLGLFLTRAFAEHAGGSLRFDTTNGTTAILEIPVARGRRSAVA